MCGIAAVARLDNQPLGPESDHLLDALADVLHHRGPDDREVLRDGQVGMAFTRLSLVDPEGGRQPLVSEDGSLVLIANGEVYNHRELAAKLPAGHRMQTGSDCEVLLHLYRLHGTDFLRDVRGMFALILWDRQRNQLILARDRFGIKPLYYHRDSSRIILSSEIKGLFCDPATPRRFSWEAALTHQTLPAAPRFTDEAQTTWFDGIESVPAATVLRIGLRDGRTESSCFWSMPTETGESQDPEFYVNNYRAALEASVRECATADTELGLFLSGGVDSSAVLALACEKLPDLHTFSAVTGGTYDNGDAESAEWLARKLGLANHSVIFPEDSTPSPEEWRRLLWLTETPACGPEVYYKHELHRFAKAERPDLRGMLLGAASDEFNGGYSVGMAVGGDWFDFMNNLGPMSVEARLRSAAVLRAWTAGRRSLVVTGGIEPDPAGPSDIYQQYLLSEHRKVQQYNVWHEDRTAAGSSIEARVPFLDHRVVEVSASVPPNLRPQLLWDKQILRLAVRDLLPAEIVQRPKVPFFYGKGTRHAYRMLVRLLRADGGELVERALAVPEAAQFLDRDNIRLELRELGDGDTDSPAVELLLRAVNMGLLAELVHEQPRLESLSSGPVLLALPESVEVSTVADAVGVVTLGPNSVLALGEDVLLLPNAPEQTWYLVGEGQVEYVLEQTTPTLEVLRGLDGTRDLAAVLAQAGAELDDVASDLDELVHGGLIVTITRS